MERFQSVNLYLPEYRPKEIIFSFSVMSSVCAGYLVVLTVIFIVTKSIAGQYNQNLLSVQEENRAFDNKLVKLRQLQRNADKTSVTSKIDLLRQRKDDLQALVQSLDRHSPDHSPGFVSQLEGLGKHIRDDISLSEISFDRETGNVSFSGITTRAESVPNYIASLSKDAVFEMSRFGMIVIYSSEDKKELSFDVGKVLNDEMDNL